MTLIPELERELTRAIRLQAQRSHAEWWRRVPLLAPLAALLLGTAVALAATGVIGFGAPESAPGTPRVRPPSPTSGYGIVRAGSSRLLTVRVADPAGGLPWGMRVAETTRGLGCVTVGRVLDGELGTLGIDGAFANDGRFHPLPVRLTDGPVACAPLDAQRELFISVSESDVPRSASVFRRCYPPGEIVGARASELCPEHDERNIYYGLLGPQATSVTYEYASTTHTVTPQGPQGAYLIVLPAAGGDDFNGVTSSLLPTNSAITQVTYRSGLVCHFSRAEVPAPAGSCRTPPGYIAARTPHPTTAQLRTPITATASRSPHAAWSITVAFRARVAIKNALSQYTVELHTPGTPQAIAIGSTSSDLRSGQQAQMIFSNLTRPGLYTGTVTFSASSRPGGRGFGGTLVGRFSARIP
ncbi:MAG: hypothetical protein ABSG93_06750 [Solirubrobacteraceae bacterium]|jgi:hypothetical protein